MCIRDRSNPEAWLVLNASMKGGAAASTTSAPPNKTRVAIAATITNLRLAPNLRANITILLLLYAYETMNVDAPAWKAQDRFGASFTWADDEDDVRAVPYAGWKTPLYSAGLTADCPGGQRKIAACRNFSSFGLPGESRHRNLNAPANNQTHGQEGSNLP